MLHRLTSSLGLVLTLVALPAAAATVDGIPLHWSSSGSGSRTVMLIHGWTCDSTSWDAQVPALARQYRVIVLDLPGHGKSGSPASGMLSMELFARAVEAVRSEAGADKVVLVGHSMGTPVIREYARLYPQRVTALVAADGMFVAPGGGAGGRGAMPPMNLTGPAGLAARETMIRSMFGTNTPREVQDKVLKMMLGAPEATATGAMNAMMAWMGKAQDSTPQRLPVLGIYAEKSVAGNREATTKLFPSFEYQEIPGTSHFLMMEKPDEFNRRLTTFLAKLTD
jgi:pimeloyl-ACP methyl ester carboxylesterase